MARAEPRRGLERNRHRRALRSTTGILLTTARITAFVALPLLLLVLCLLDEIVEQSDRFVPPVQHPVIGGAVADPAPGIAQQISNVNIVQPATFISRPVSPKKTIILLLGLFVATTGGIGVCIASEFNTARRQQPAVQRSELAVALTR